VADAAPAARHRLTLPAVLTGGGGRAWSRATAATADVEGGAGQAAARAEGGLADVLGHFGGRKP
jgi:hypothetical protein